MLGWGESLVPWPNLRLWHACCARALEWSYLSIPDPHFHQTLPSPRFSCPSPSGGRSQLYVSLRSRNHRSLLSLSHGQELFTADPPTEQWIPPGPQGWHCSLPLASSLKLLLPTWGGPGKQEEPRACAWIEADDLLSVCATTVLSMITWDLSTVFLIGTW